MMPQQPLHHAMFTKTVARFSSKQLHTVTSPKFELDHLPFIGTSGQFIEDIRRSTATEDSIELMKLTLSVGHLCKSFLVFQSYYFNILILHTINFVITGPTCPDTMACYPYFGKDPFILKQLPLVYFCGNQEKFQHDIYKDCKGNKVHMLSLPRFGITGTCVFFNLRTLESEEISF